MATLLKKEKRAIYLRKIRGFWEEFSHNKIGITGLVLLFVYIGTAVFAPWLTPYDPLHPPELAASMAMPEWVTILPQYKDLPRTMNKTLYLDVLQESELVTKEGWGEEMVLRFVGKGTTERAEVILNASFYYPYKVAVPKFATKFTWIVEEINSTEYTFDLFMVNTTGGQFRFWTERTDSINKESSIILKSTQRTVLLAFGVDPSVQIVNLAEMIFNQPGEYKLLLRIYFTPTSETAKCKVTVKDAYIFLPGRVHGILGTDYLGYDVFTDLVYGSRISLLIGLLAAFIGVVLGTLVGVASGYTGGVVDEIAMRSVDVMIAIPTLPILLAFITIFGPNIFYIIILVAFFGWQGLSRVVRSQVLSLKEAAFVECAVASGASRGYIMIRHLVPNVFPIVISSFILRVPGAILTEASLSFLGFSDPGAPTWGRMLNVAFSWGAFRQLAWWWILPPGLAITLLCLAFVFMGHAIDEIVNPRLRRRR